MINHQSCENQSTVAVPRPFDRPRFVSATTVANCTRTVVEIMPEMTDEEILAHTIEFEKKHPQ